MTTNYRKNTLLRSSIKEQEKAIIAGILYAVVAFVERQFSLVASSAYMIVMSIVQYWRLTTSRNGLVLLKSETYFEYLKYLLTFLLFIVFFLVVLIAGA